MPWLKIATFPLSKNLTPLLQRFEQAGVDYRVTEEVNGQCLWLADRENADLVAKFIADPGFEDWLDSAAVAKVNSDGTTGAAHKKSMSVTIKFPVTIILILLGCMGGLLVKFDPGYEWITQLTFYPLVVDGDKGYFGSVMSGLEAGQWWRLISPVFLHFGVLHIVFNGLWVWEFGRRIETVLGGPRYLLLAITIGVISNLSQALWAGPSVFGGLSGVVYGLMGWLWIYHRLKPSDITAINPSIVGLMLIKLVICMTGALDFFIGGGVANAAHLGGLLIGALLGAISARFPTVKGGFGRV